MSWWEEAPVEENFGDLYADLPLPARPEDIPFPSDLSEAQDADLSRLLTYLSSLVAHAEYQLSLVDGARTRAKMQYDFAYSEQFVALGPKMAATEKTRRIDLIPKVRKYREAIVEAENHYAVLKALVSGYNTKMSAVSRELTRRIAEMRRLE